MKLLPPRIVSLGVLALALAAYTSAGVASASTTPPEPAETAAGCAEITAVLALQESLLGAYISEDAAAIADMFASLPALGEAAVAAAPPEIAEAVATWAEPFPEFAAMTEGLDPSDFETIDEVFSSAPPTPESDAAGEEVMAWASENCGWVSGIDDLFAEPVEPQDCAILDAAAAAAAAGVDLDVTDSDGTGDFSLPGFWTKSCSYGNGAMSLSTFSFIDLEQVTAFYMENLFDEAGNPVGEVLDVDLGSLPASTLVTSVDGAVTVSVFEATVPFSVMFTDDIDPAAVVAAAEAVFAGLPAEVPPPPMSSEAP